MSKNNHLTACPICLGEELNPFLVVPDHLLTKEDFEVVKCSSCHFVFTANPPSEENAGAYYETEEYIEHSDNKKGLVNRLYHLGRDYMLSVKHRLINKHVRGKAILDIGSASGYFLNFMKQKGYAVTGVEISEKARQLCMSNFGISAFEPAEFSSNSLPQKYDAITMWHVLEHVYPLREYLLQIHQYLTEDGVLFVAMPNHTSSDAKYYKESWAAYDTPRHLWHFEPKTFEKILNQTGFALVKMKHLPLDPFYNSMVSSQYKNGRTKYLGSFAKGLHSYLSSLTNVKKASSIIYIIKKSNS